MMANLQNVANVRVAAREAKKQADAAFYEDELARQRERFSDAHGQCTDDVRREAACWIAAAAMVFERDAERIPSRAKRAVELLKHRGFHARSEAPA
ncbi:hypothetical protein DW076_17555 [Clostridium sp. AF46-12NS]|nr:hypothetical protein DW076_17555 [Clostridium sp. AF46-12NS]